MSKNFKNIPAPPRFVSVSEGFRLAHADFHYWLYSRHDLFLEALLSKVELIGLRREDPFYALAITTSTYLVFGSKADVISGFICTFYPVSATIDDMIDGRISQRWLVFWPTYFLTGRCLDSFAPPTYWLLKTLFMIYIFLPQTDGARFLWERIYGPIWKFFDDNVIKRVF